MDEWERCSAWIQAALDRAGNTHNLSDVRAMCEDGRAHFWPFPQCAFVTEFIEYPKFRAFNVWLGGGSDLSALSRMQSGFELWARENGCRRIQCGGPLAWQRILKGSRPAGVLLVKELT